MPIPRPLVRAAVTAFQAVRRSWWRVRRPVALGVHGVCLTPSGEVVLIRITYGAGWRLPGGGRKKGEEPRAAMLRELSEEIGLESHGAVRPVLEFTHRPEHRRGVASLFLVEDARYRFRKSLEVEEARAFAPDALPPDATALTRRLVSLALAQREPAAPALLDLTDF